MPFFYPTRREGDRVEIRGGDARHLAGPLRARVGERIAVVDPAGELLSVELGAVTSRAVIGRVVAARPYDPEPRTRITIAIAMLPAAALEHVLSRCTELGATGFLLVQAERSVARGAKPERWASICREAAMLAGRLVVPVVGGPVTFDRLLANPGLVILDPEAERSLPESLPEDRILTLAVGPEGGWSPAEKEAARGRLVKLGPRTLRADTAALAALTAALLLRLDL
jgi:16S rRNA (uracil1498-N3)-methyltransferase